MPQSLTHQRTAAPPNPAAAAPGTLCITGRTRSTVFPLFSGKASLFSGRSLSHASSHCRLKTKVFTARPSRAFVRGIRGRAVGCFPKTTDEQAAPNRISQGPIPAPQLGRAVRLQDPPVLAGGYAVGEDGPDLCRVRQFGCVRDGRGLNVRGIRWNVGKSERPRFSPPVSWSCPVGVMRARARALADE